MSNSESQPHESGQSATPTSPTSAPQAQAYANPAHPRQTTYPGPQSYQGPQSYPGTQAYPGPQAYPSPAYPGTNQAFPAQGYPAYPPYGSIPTPPVQNKTARVARGIGVFNLCFGVLLAIGLFTFPVLTGQVDAGSTAEETLLSTLIYTDADLPFLLALAGIVAAIIGAVFAFYRGRLSTLAAVLVPLGGAVLAGALLAFCRADAVRLTIDFGAAYGWGFWVYVVGAGVLIVTGFAQIVALARAAKLQSAAR
ncbi:hypothetical protein SAMN05421878_10470 [Actinobaculum suis]|uniref:Uncharacterized protein n=1 Tax=Actinobaculum suis TaxID=1657 RepID=A0A1G7BB66_9ACTO|nr:hypothetical protein [Actinobaculum suis]MDY5153619.1 hypothetical protein [Actinobaculum suis]SDE23485.1 hypothetical protein SAMN05421878_10470 [Actinobaculum suis]